MVKVDFISSSIAAALSYNEIIIHIHSHKTAYIQNNSIMQKSNIILNSVFESMPIEITKEKKEIMARPWLKPALLFAWLSHCKMTSEIYR